MMTLPFRIGESRTWEEAIAESGSILNGFFTSLKRVYPGLRYYWVREIGRKSNMVHFHVQIDRYIPRPIISAIWERVGGGFVADIRIKGMGYSLKYLAKYAEYPAEVNAALRGKRRWSCSRKLLLPVVRMPSEPGWVFVCKPPWQWYGVHIKEVIEGVVYFEEGGP
jgi:hypothetical protein